MNHVLFALLFFLPAGLANAAPPLINKIPFVNRWKTPLDFGVIIRGHRLFGKNKTWRGLVGGMLVGGLCAWILYPYLGSVGAENGKTVSHFIIGASLGFGALAGDAVESFFKRQLGIASGNSWLVFDQIDYVIGAILFSFPFVHLDIIDYLAVIVTYFCLHFIVSYIGFLLGFKDKPI